MDEKVKEFIEKAKRIEAEKEKNERARVLRAVGLVKESNSGDRIPCHFDDTGAVYDKDEQRFYRINTESVPIDVTDEEFAEIKKYADKIEDKPIQAEKISTDSECSVKKVASFILWVGIISAILGCILGVVYLFENFGWIFFVVGFSNLFSSIVCSSVMKVFANISLRINKINDFLQDNK